MKECNHPIGYLYDYNHTEEIRLNNLEGLTKFNTDARHSCMRKFTHCPDCAIRIDWKSIREKLK